MVHRGIKNNLNQMMEAIKCDFKECFSNKSSAPFDGRIARLDSKVLNHITGKTTELEPDEKISFDFVKGRFSEQDLGSVHVSWEKIPGLDTRTVLKVMKKDSNKVKDSFAKKSFQNELKAGTLRHFGVQPVLAIYEDSYQMCVLSAFSELGDLEEIIKQDEQWCEEKRTNSNAEGELLLKPYMRLRVLIQISSAVQYTLRFKIAHLDIKLANIVLDANFNARLIDFGLSQHRDTAFDPTNSTPGYLPNECNAETRAENVVHYSFGVVMLATITGESPVETNVHSKYGTGCQRPVRELKKDFEEETNCQCYFQKCLKALEWKEIQKKIFLDIVNVAMRCLKSIKKHQSEFNFDKQVCQKLINIWNKKFDKFDIYSRIKKIVDVIYV